MYGGIAVKRNVRSYIALLLCVAISLSWALPAGAVEGLSAPARSSNLGDNEYSYDRWANPIKSYLIPNEDGTLTRVEYTGQVVTVEEYSADFQFISGFTLEPELPLFGGFYSGSTHNFFVYGQLNDAEDDSAEVYRVVCYTKDWQRVGSDSLYGANTTTPFRGGSLRFAECDGYLYIRTCHEMYTSTDGRRHQANVMINFRMTDTTITDSYWKVMNSNFGYVSHSFNQFVLVDGQNLVTVDHGDAYPRAVALMKYHAPAGQDSFMKAVVQDYRRSYVKEVDILPMVGNTGANDTGLALGGFDVSDTSYLIAGNSISQEPGSDLYGQRNIFVSVTSKEDFSEEGTTVHFLTDYIDGNDITLSPPYLVKINNQRFVLLWMETSSSGSNLRYCFIDGQGQLLSAIYAGEGALSDCKPVVAGDHLVWYITNASAPNFCSLSLTDPDRITHDHTYRYEYTRYPSYRFEGSLSSSCAICGLEGPQVVVPAIKNMEHYTLYRWEQEPTCTESGYGYFQWKDDEIYSVSGWIFGGAIPALGHDWSVKDCNAPRFCLVCGETPEILDHNYVEEVTKDPTCAIEGERTFTCTECGHSYTQPIETYEHFYWTKELPPTCTEAGCIVFTCFYCKQHYQEYYGEPNGHSYDAVVTPPSTTQAGYTTYTCTTCGDSYVADEVPALDRTLTGTITSYLDDEEVTVELLLDGQVVAIQTADPEGRYCFFGLEEGAYTLRISKKNHVSLEFAVELGQEEAVLDAKICPVGDITGDGDVTIKDFQRMLRHINRSNPLREDQLAYGDLTGDGDVTIKDFQRMLRHINRSKPLY